MRFERNETNRCRMHNTSCGGGYFYGGKMQYPEELRTAAEAYAESFDRKKLAKAAAAISDRYREERGDGSDMIGGAAEAAAYAAVRMPATFAAMSEALGHALMHYGGKLARAADIGSGTGAAVWAAALLTDGLEEVHCFERSEEMRRLGERLMKEGGIPVNVRWSSLDITAEPLPDSYDLITACYVLNELTGSNREKTAAMLWERTRGMLLIVEPGTKKGYENIMQVRKLLIKSGADIAYPCPDTKECPLPDDDWCHFTARAARTKLHKQLKGGDVPYEDEKFCCIAAVRENSAPCGSRILRHPHTVSGMTELYLCTPEGIRDIKVTRSSKSFKAARKAGWGDAW